MELRYHAVAPFFHRRFTIFSHGGGSVMPIMSANGNPKRITEQNDLTVIGAGFAGLACARTAAAEGTKTVVLERKPCPGANIRTTGILVQEAADFLKLPKHLSRKINGVRLYSPKGKWIDLSSPGYSFVATDTPGMMRWLANRAVSAGAELHCSRSVSRFQRAGDHVVLPEVGMQTRFLVGCDGARSNVARAFGLSINRDHLIGAEAGIRGYPGFGSGQAACVLGFQTGSWLHWLDCSRGRNQSGRSGRA